MLASADFTRNSVGPSSACGRGGTFMSLKILSVLLASSMVSVLVACGGDQVASDAPNATSGGNENNNPPPGAECENGATRCDGDARQSTCENRAFAASVACVGEAVCRDGACRAPTSKQLAQAKELGEMLTYVKGQTAWHSPLDWESLRLQGRKQIIGGDGTDRAYFGALYKAFHAVPQGHQGLYLNGSGVKSCGRLVPFMSYSQRGACARPHGTKGAVIVTNARANNLLGVKAGDIITRIVYASVGGASTNVIATLADRPMCAASKPSASFNDAVTAATFTDLLEKGDEISIESPNGTTRTFTMPDGQTLTGDLNQALSCQDPLGRNTGVAVEAEMRPDGVGVIRLPGFTDAEQVFPENPTQAELDEYRNAFEAKIKTAFDTVKSAPMIVWDIRGNGGGLTMVGLGIASGFPGASPLPLSHCVARKPNTDPPEFDTFHYASYALSPAATKFPYTGKVAILIDGLNYSAADYFPLAVKTRTNALVVGAGTAGAYGATSTSKAFNGNGLPFNVSVDLNRCVDDQTGAPLEGKSVAPSIPVDYLPSDLAAGKDTILERAIASLKK